MLMTPAEPLLYSWAGLNAAGTTKRVVVFATMFVFQCAGNVSRMDDRSVREGLTTELDCRTTVILEGRRALLPHWALLKPWILRRSGCSHGLHVVLPAIP